MNHLVLKREALRLEKGRGRYLTAIPFDGFYQSWSIDALDGLIERSSEDMAQEHALEIKQSFEIFNAAIDCKALFEPVAKAYIHQFAQGFEHAFQMAFECELDQLDSTILYNYSTDRIYAYIDHNTLKGLVDANGHDDNETLAISSPMPQCRPSSYGSLLIGYGRVE